MSIIVIGTTSSKDEINGQSICFDQLIQELTKSTLSYKLIDINFVRQTKIRKAFSYIVSYVSLFFYLIFFRKIKMVYLTIAQSLNGFARDFFFIWISSIYRKKIIIHLHGGNYKNFYLSKSFLLKKIIKKTLDKCDIIIVLSENFKSLFDFVDNYEDKVRVVQNGIACLHHSPVIKIFDNQKPIILYLSNLIESKGYFDVLKSVVILKEKYKIEPKVIFCGKFLSSSDDYLFKNTEKAQDAFETFIIENKLQKNVKFEGLVQGATKLRILNESNFMILPTNYYAEGQPMSLIEGLAYSCVLITTSYRDIPAINIEPITGFYVPYNNPEAIASIIISFDDIKYNVVSRNSYFHFKQNYSLDRSIENLKSIFHEFI